MRLPVPHFHRAAAAGLLLGLAGLGCGLVWAGPAHADPRPSGAIPAQQVPPQGNSDENPNDSAPDGAETSDPATALAEPAAPADATTQARQRANDDLEMLFAELAQPDGETWMRAESDILRIWSRSGSATADLLYKRGEAALDAGDSVAAIGHLTALTDHAPDFAAGWHLRAVAFYLNGEFGPALADLGRALQLEPRHFVALTQLGSILEELGQSRRALEVYRASLKIHLHQQDAQDAVRRIEQEQQGTDA